MKKSTIGVLIVFFVLPTLLFAQAGSQEVQNRRTQLEQELSLLERDIEAQKKILSEKRQEAVSLERDLAILKAQIQEAELSIRARDINITRLTSDISSKQSTIIELSEKLVREKESLAQLLRKTQELDQFSFVEVILSNSDLSDFFIDIDSFGSIKKELHASFDIIEETKVATTEEKEQLEARKIEETELRTLQVLQKQRIEERKKERDKLLQVTKGQEKAYQTILSEKEKSAASIRSELFQLAGSSAIPFGKALDYANEVSKKTGVRPALILGVITQETNLGENVGQCLLTNNPKKGDGKGKNTGRYFSQVMKGTRDVDPFMRVTQALGFDPFAMPVSCPPSYGFGGAMGPAQFIPSTWVLYEDKVAELTGHNPPNPWDPYDAFTASAYLLKENGAAKGTYAAERLAALRYFAGWKNATKSAYAFYGDDVMELATKYQKQIDILEGKAR